ncbi:MAG: hydrogenase formation protein HypD [Bdellovibrio sp.]|nr:MAG: hydrogenase formation protein HypD [Bdellovibrio sp.]
MNEALRTLSKGFSSVRIMEFCGGHTHALVRSGLLSLLPKQLRMIHGPGCPVCVLPPHHLQAVMDLLGEHPSLTAVVYGDLMRIPTLGGQTLAQMPPSSVKMIYSPMEILKLAEEHPERQFLFLAIGFETTAPATAVLLKELRRRNTKNVFVLCLHVLTPPAVQAVMDSFCGGADGTDLGSPGDRPEAIIGPGHVSLVTGISCFEAMAQRFKIPIVISGFEGSDLAEAVAMILRLLQQGQTGVFNQYTRALRPEGNRQAQSLLAEVMTVRSSFVWRGLGELPRSALALNAEWSEFDAEKRFELKYRSVPEHPLCQCGAILRGQKRPDDCRLFNKACLPTRPLGACMVSSEGACHAYLQRVEEEART